MNLQTVFENVRIASHQLNKMSEEKINRILFAIADAAIVNINDILAANEKDLQQMDKANPMYDRLLLNKDRIQTIAADIRNVAKLQSPINEILSTTMHPNGMKIQKIRVPFGVVGVIYESRPNVSFEVFSLCFKTKNACILKGGKEALHSNEVIISIIHAVLERENINKNIVTLLPADRSATAELIQAIDFVDLIIPRGGRELIHFVRNNARVPMIETGAGVCHIYFDKSGDVHKGADIIFNAKTRRVSVCNALDCLIIHTSRLPDLPILCKSLATQNVIIYADTQAYQALQDAYPKELLQHAQHHHFGIEFLDYKMAIKTVVNIDCAIEHILHYSSKHSEVIIAENYDAITVYLQQVDAACVYANVSTAFTDGAQFGMGAEIGISTQKLHARGPMGLSELTSYKYIITGNGQIRQ